MTQRIQRSGGLKLVQNISISIKYILICVLICLFVSQSICSELHDTNMNAEKSEWEWKIQNEFWSLMAQQVFNDSTHSTKWETQASTK